MKLVVSVSSLIVGMASPAYRLVQAQCHLHIPEDDRLISLNRQDVPLYTAGTDSANVTVATYSTPRVDSGFSSTCHLNVLPETMAPGLYVL